MSSCGASQCWCLGDGQYSREDYRASKVIRARILVVPRILPELTLPTSRLCLPGVANDLKVSQEGPGSPTGSFFIMELRKNDIVTNSFGI